MKPTQNNAEKKTVLFVDDEKMILEVGSLMLQRLGYNVLTTRKPSKFLKTIK
jgi:CheY-like chemotaxis protein